MVTLSSLATVDEDVEAMQKLNLIIKGDSVRVRGTGGARLRWGCCADQHRHTLALGLGLHCRSEPARLPWGCCADQNRHTLALGPVQSGG